MASTTLQPPHSSAAASGHVRSVLLVGEAAGLEPALRETLGRAATLVTCPSWFDAIAQLTRSAVDAVFLPAAAVTRRPDAAIAAVREAAGVMSVTSTSTSEPSGSAPSPAQPHRSAGETKPVPGWVVPRLIAVGEPVHEGLCRRLVELGCDDYGILPATPAELHRLLIRPGPETLTPSFAVSPAGARRAEPGPPAETVAISGTSRGQAGDFGQVASASPFARLTPLVAEILLDALVREPADAAQAAMRELNARLPAGARLQLLAVTDPDPVIPPGMQLLSRLIRGRPASTSDAAALDTPLPQAIASPTAPEAATTSAEPPLAVLHLFLASPLDERAASDFLDHLAGQLARQLELQHRHRKLQTLAITDELTGLHNARYFKHFLQRTLVKARQGRFPVTLLLFDIDGFKTYNDTYGHAVGDEILRQTARMIRRCVRDHDLVARLGGDEFAVVFWEKDGPRQALHAPPDKPVSHRPPQSPVQVFERFKRLIASHDFAALGPTGRGSLTISGGLAVYPYDATTADELIAAADNALMFGAKRSGKNTIHLVGQDSGVQ